MYTTVSKKISQNLVPSLKKEKEKKKILDQRVKQGGW